MKIISLNTWGGRLRDPIDDFVQRHAGDTDIFCFQEVYAGDTTEADLEAGERPDFFSELQKLLPGFIGTFSEQVPGTGHATFVRDTLEIESADSCPILSHEELSHLRMPDGSHYYPRIIQLVRIGKPRVAIYNFHGVPGSEKKDTAERELQMQRLHAALEKYNGEKVLVGDFNLRPDTQAIHSLEKKMRNLVVECGFETTRTPHYEKRATMPFADYTFVTSGIKVNRFEVLPDDVSDHSPMYLEFEVS